jgi:hypothetical protein
VLGESDKYTYQLHCYKLGVVTIGVVRIGYWIYSLHL